VGDRGRTDPSSKGCEPVPKKFNKFVVQFTSSYSNSDQRRYSFPLTVSTFFVSSPSSRRALSAASINSRQGT
jgi:hypothetical protein